MAIPTGTVTVEETLPIPASDWPVLERALRLAAHAGAFDDADLRTLAMLADMVAVARGRAILCPECRTVSHHPTDIEQRYCPTCHQYHDIMAAARALGFGPGDW